MANTILSSSAPAGPPSSAASSSSTRPPLDPKTEAEAFKRLYPREYLSRFLDGGYRPDGRKRGEWREAAVNIGSVKTANGSTLVRQGDTTIVCGVTAEISEPDFDRPGEGFIVPNLDLPAISSPAFKPGPPTDEAQVHSQHLYELLTSSAVLPLSSLCIHPGKAAWVLYIDAVCINYDGNAFDALCLAVMGALRDARLPTATYDAETGQTTCSPVESRPLELGNMPLSCTFGLYDNKYLIPDPTAFEEPLCSSTITIALDGPAGSRHGAAGGAGKAPVSGAIRLIRQTGLSGLPLAPGGAMDGAGVLGECLAMAKARVGELAGLI